MMIKNDMNAANNPNPSQRNFWLVAFDVLFIMLLCFATLLSTMLMRGAVIVGSGSAGGFEYSFDISTFLITACALGFYLAYIIKKSDAELSAMIENVYSEENAA